MIIKYEKNGIRTIISQDIVNIIINYYILIVLSIGWSTYGSHGHGHTDGQNMDRN